MQTLCGRLDKDTAALDRLIHRQVNPDMHIRRFRTFSRRAVLYYLDGFVSADMLQHYVLTPLTGLRDAEAGGSLAENIADAVSSCDVQTALSAEEAAVMLVNGRAVVLAEGMNHALGFDVRMYVRRGISPPLTENVVLGPHQGFNESIRDSITLIRRILPSPDLIGEMRTVGDRYPTSLCIMYLDKVVNQENLQTLRNRLDGICTDHVMSIGMLQQLLEDSPMSLLPQCCLTERPDRAASMLLEGQIVLVMEGSPQVLIMPVSILHLLHSPEDSSARWQYGAFMRIIRFIGLLCALLLPGLFAAFVTFHPEALPVTLLTAILESQASVPLSIPAETFLMLIMFNLIGEASMRVPSAAGSILGAVSGLILGQAAVEAKLVHPLLLIVVAVASLGSYAVPDYSLSLAVRIGQLILLAAGCIFGVYGMVLFITAGTARLCSLTSLGSPYAAPASPWRHSNRDGLMRWPIWRQRWRTWLADPQEQKRGSAAFRSWDRRRK